MQSNYLIPLIALTSVSLIGAAPFKPTIQNLHACTLRAVCAQKNAIPVRNFLENLEASSGIPTENPVVVDDTRSINIQESIGITANDTTATIYSRGYTRRNSIKEGDGYTAKGGGFSGAWKAIRNNIVHTPCIGFDYHDDKKTFNFGQKTDQECLQLMYDSVIKANPSIDIILNGDCRGGKCILHFLTQHSDNIKAAVLESPFVAMKYVADKLSRSFTWFVPASDFLIKSVFKTWFDNYKESEDNLLKTVQNIPKNMPIFIGHLINDKLVSNQSILNLTRKLQETGHTEIYLLLIYDKTVSHSRIMKLPTLQKAVNAFLAKYHLSHDPILAAQGQELLKAAHMNAKVFYSMQWVINREEK